MKITEKFTEYIKNNTVVQVFNDFGEIRDTNILNQRKSLENGRLVFANGWCVSVIVTENDKASIAPVDYNGYFCWSKDDKEYPLICSTEEEIVKECELIRHW